MLSIDEMESFYYIPYLAISPSEMNALEELPNKDKNKLLPLFQLKGWATAKTLEKTIDRIKKSIGERYWIADIDETFVRNNAEWLLTGKYPEREVFSEINALLDPNNGYSNWFNFINETPFAIPTVQWGSIENLYNQIESLSSIGRGVVVRITRKNGTNEVDKALKALAKYSPKNCHIMLDLGQISGKDFKVEDLTGRIDLIKKVLPKSTISISASSFPSQFSGYNKGENPIHERILFNQLKRERHNSNLFYSDRGGARAEKVTGGGGIPSPRIDYPLKNDWRYVREEYKDSNLPLDGEKEELYTLCAKKIMAEEYWTPDLRLWGTQMIEQTALGDKFGINSPAKATAVRINIHLHTQLHYNTKIEEIDTDDEWID
ncbi:beta family protein [Alteromonas sp. PRIM-21]|uniref:beta family protein n=1 Tax=Alteromonas sp. PRIM-21 TaxID=1454978 RepID=UPI0022B9B4EF|nr:beta family protein [Alteromonas sp. PRIM-21]MCZ8529858.1 beta family protein [Alteromonas sp. PRIM-21]